VAARLGWIGAKTSAEKAHAELVPKIPPEIRYELHMQLIAHGRTVCSARRPRCSECVLLDLCDAGPRLLASAEAR
jgi:endonuclease-3